MSFALIMATEDRIVAASDSRARLDGSDRFVEGVQKIHLDRDGWAFAATGLGDLALKAWRRSLLDGDSASSIAKRVLCQLNTMELEGSGDVVFGIFRYAGPQGDAHVMKLRIDDHRLRVVDAAHVTTLPYALAFGWDDGGQQRSQHLRQVIVPCLHLRPSEDQMTGMARDTMQMAAAQSQKVGGQVYVAVIDAHGSRWETADATLGR